MGRGLDVEALGFRLNLVLEYWALGQWPTESGRDRLNCTMRLMSESLPHLFFPLNPPFFNQAGGARIGALLIGGPIPKELNGL